MKAAYYIVTLLTIFLAGFQTSEAQTKWDAQSYLDTIIGFDAAIAKRLQTFDGYMKEYENNFDTTRAMEYFVAIVNEAENAAIKVKELPPFKRSVDLRDAAAGLFDCYVDYLRRTMWFHVSYTFSASPSSAVYDSYQLYAKEASFTMDLWVRSFVRASEEFAQKYNLSIPEPQTTESIEEN